MNNCAEICDCGVFDSIKIYECQNISMNKLKPLSHHQSLD